MKLFDRRPALRWAVPAGAVGLIVAGTLAAPLAATADAGLPPRTAQELLVALQESPQVPVSGTIATRADLGLPQLPMDMASDSGPLALATGEKTLRMWADGPTRQRLAVIERSAETTVIRNGEVAWVWSSADATADRYQLPEEQVAAPPDAGDLPPGVTLPSTPQEAAEMLLKAIDPSTAVTTSGLATVAGRDAYELVLTPRDTATLVRDVRVALDAQTSTPLRVQVHSTRTPDPAFEVGFTSVSFDAPDPALFEFTPPAGATVTEHDLTEPAAPAKGSAAGTEPTVVGKGWSAVLIGDLPADSLADLAESGSRAAQEGGSDDPAATALALLGTLPEASGDWGSGRVLAGTLFSVILTDDGRFAVGAVSPEALGAALADA
jgi:outer membrane lipoprotein-sorting protein